MGSFWQVLKLLLKVTKSDYNRRQEGNLGQSREGVLQNLCELRKQVDHVLYPSCCFALNTNEFILALRDGLIKFACGVLIFDKLNNPNLYIPLQVIIELNHNLSNSEKRKSLGS